MLNDRRRQLRPQRNLPCYISSGALTRLVSVGDLGLPTLTDTTATATDLSKGVDQATIQFVNLGLV